MTEYLNMLQKQGIKYDSNKEMDIPYGEEYLSQHNITTFKDAKTIFTDTRLRKLFNTIMQEALSLQATDVLIRPEERFGVVSFRLGRRMTPYRLIHIGAVESLVTFIRKEAETNPEAIKRPISSKLRYKYYKSKEDEELENLTVVDTRLQFHPTNLGSALSIRIFYQDKLDMSIDDLGLPDIVTYNYKQALKLNEGLIILSGATGSGKALSLETDIPMSLVTSDGLLLPENVKTPVKKLKDVLVGDYILNPYGEPCKVLAVYDHKNKDVYKITFSDGNTIVADKEHVWEICLEDSTVLKNTLEIQEILKDEKVWIENIRENIIYPERKTKRSPYNFGKKIVFEGMKDFKKNIATFEDILYNSVDVRLSFLNGIFNNTDKLNNSFQGHVVYFDNLKYRDYTRQILDSLGAVTKTNDYDGSLKVLENPDTFYNHYREILYVEYLGVENTRCLTVDSLDRLFLISKSYIPTHNTTTQYVGALQLLKDSNYLKNIVTAEDPVEFQIEGITQSEIDDINDFTFNEATRSFLRMNPDVIIVGEVRDEATAQNVTRASTSGHLTLTSIHANSTLEVLSVLKQYKVHPNDIVNAVKLIIFQVLEERLCPHCREQTILKTHQKKWLDNKLFGKEQLATVYKKNPEGCSHCDYTGIKGRIMICEMLSTTLEFRILNETYSDNIDVLKRELVKSEDNVFYPIEWDVHRRIKDGDIDFETATRLIH